MSGFESIAAACTILDLHPLHDGLQILQAAALLPRRSDWPAGENPSDGAWSEIQGVGSYVPVVQPFPLLATRPVLLGMIETVDLGALATALRQRYPTEHPLSLVCSDKIVWQGPLAKLGAQQVQGQSWLFIPPLAPLADVWSADGPTTVMVRLLGPQGCPWDREQTHRSLRKDLLGETHEVLEAIDAGDAEALGEELGDLLLQVLIHAEIARQAGEFTLNDVYHHLATKLIRRHPHVFGDVQADESATVVRNWDAIKQAERAAKGQVPRGSLDGIPVSLPALSLAQETLKKASKAGFDADSIAWDWAKLHEEVTELAEAAEHGHNQGHIEEEFGDLLLILTKLARKLDIEAESALRTAVAKFRKRFTAMETLMGVSGRDLKTMSETEKVALWDEAKRMVGRPTTGD